MTVVRSILLGTFILSATYVSEVAAKGAANHDNTVHNNAVRTNAFDRFRPGSSYSASGLSTASGPSAAANGSRNSSGPQGLPRTAVTRVQHDLKPTLTNELRIAPATFQRIEDTKPSLSEMKLTEQEVTLTENLADTAPAKLQAKPPATSSADSLVEKLSSALDAEPVKALEPRAIPTDKSIKSDVDVVSIADSEVVANSPTNESISEMVTEEPSPDSDTRKLGFSTATVSPTGNQAKSPFNDLLAWRPSTNSLVTMGSGLAVVLGLVMIAGWIARKSMPRSARVLPNEVAEVLGRVVLSSRQTAQLLKVGNKLILVSVTADGAETLTEIKDPEEVQRLLQLSEDAHGRGSNAEFERVFQQLANGPAADGFLGDEAPAYDDPRYQDPRTQNRDNVHYDTNYDAQRLAAAYANTPGGRSNAA